MEQNLLSKNKLDRYKLEVLEVYAIRQNESSTVEETGQTNLQKLREIKSMDIRWEASWNKKSIVILCHNCLHLGHRNRNCHLKERCKNCGGAQKADECQVQEAQPKRCANCSGPHEALDRNCPKRAEFIRSRQQTSKPKPLVRKTDKRSLPVPVFTAADFPPLPGAVPVVDPKDPHPRTAGSKQRDTGPRAGAP